MILYLDTCCFNRPFDDQTQKRIYDETGAIIAIFKRCEENHDVLVGSTVLRLEIAHMPDSEKKANTEMLYSFVQEEVLYSDGIGARAEAIRRQTGIKIWDSLHLASAESGYAEVFLTTDDRLIKSCRKIPLCLRVMNPVSYLMEVSTNA